MIIVWIASGIFQAVLIKTVKVIYKDYNTRTPLRETANHWRELEGVFCCMLFNCDAPLLPVTNCSNYFDAMARWRGTKGSNTCSNAKCEEWCAAEVEG